MWGILILIIAIVGVVLSGGASLYMYRRAKTDEVARKKAMQAVGVHRVISQTPVGSKPVDCKMSDWSVWSPCSAECGGGEKVRTRQVIEAPSNGGKECGHTTEREICNGQACPTDCAMGGWTDWSSCSVACGGNGTQTRSRSAIQSSVNVGKECPTQMETRKCGTQPCITDCKMSDWTTWSACSAECGSGEKVRTRQVIESPANGGKKCGHTTEREICNTKGCPKDCTMGEWSEWSACIGPCGGNGTQTRTRQVIESSTNGGKACQPQSETRTCVTQPCPIDCKMSDWSSWSSCSIECGGGEKARTRQLIASPANGGKACGPTIEREMCNTQGCPTDCIMGEWSEWSACSVACGGNGTQTRTRRIISSSTHGGKACPPQSETRLCGAQPCPVDCKMSDWSSWSACSTDCGGGEKVRTRKVLASSVGNGKECGHTIERETCNTQNCPTDCVVGEWTDWSSCSVACGGNGIQTRTRPILRPSANGGKACPILSETRSCGTQACRADCKVSEWGPWGECDKACAGGTQKRTRAIIQGPVAGGKECPKLVESQECNTGECPEDCKVSNWSDWSACTKTCGGGTQVRKKEVIKPAKNGGKECGVLAETQQCNTQACPVNCEVSTWSDWGSCSKTCGGGTQTRMRTITVQSANGGNACPQLTDTQNCNTQSCPPPPPTLSTNGKCGLENGNTHCPPGQCCSTSGVCGTSADQCYNNRRTETIYHGKDVPLASLFAPVNCEVSAWSSWSSCDKPCGGGSQLRTRTVAKQPLNGGTACPMLQESQPCNSQACPIDCKESAWSEWGPCVGGIQTRTRDVDSQAKNGGKDCGPLVETRKCAVDCMMTDWSAWSTCDKPCGGGSQTRTRDIKTPAINGGAECGAKIETQSCNTRPCATDCVLSEWSEWSACDKDCGPGQQTRTRTVRSQPTNGGVACPNPSTNPEAYKQTKDCNVKECPVPCVQGQWGQWGTCVAGKQTRTRPTLTPAQHGGTCGPLVEEQTCEMPGSVVSVNGRCGSAFGGRRCPDGQCCTAWGACGATKNDCVTGRMSDTTFHGINAPAASSFIDCELSPWTDWSTCSASCGPGKQTRTRTTKNQAAGGGDACPDPNTSPGAYREEKDCNLKECPVPCVQSGWGEWGKCTFGKRSRTRTTLIAAKNGGPCGPVVEVVDCPGSKVSTDGRCGPSFGDTRCPDDQCCSTSGTCGTTKTECATSRMAGDTYQGNQAPSASSFDPVNCELNPWSSWSACDNKCGTGSQYRSTTVKTQPRNGGTSCPPTTQLQFCNDTSGCPVNCTTSDWGPWSACSTTCGTGTQSRSRTVVAAARNGGSCPSLTETQSCTNNSGCKVDCQVSNWSVGPCSRPCAGGTLTKTRTVTQQAANGGSACPVLSENNTCNLEACNISGDTLHSPFCMSATQCLQSQNGRFTACQGLDGHFVVKDSSRVIYKTDKFSFGGILCLQDDGNLVNYGANGQAYWSSGTSGRGSRNRAVMQNDGNFVLYDRDNQAYWSTNTTQKEDCLVSAWSAWSACSKSCDGGNQSRTRTVTRQAANGGAACPSLSEQQSCNTQGCPANCIVGNWGAWGECSKTCGTGTQTRSRPVWQQPANGGSACPNLTETQNCNTLDCVDWKGHPRVKLRQVSHSGFYACGVATNDDIYCTAFDSPDGWTQIQGKMRHISLDGEKACGVNASEEVFCTDNVYKPDWKKLTGNLRQIDVQGGNMCGVDSTGAIFCAPFKTSNWSAKTGKLKQLSISGKRICGVNSDNAIHCADDFTKQNPDWTPVGGIKKQIDIDGDRMCGITLSDDPFCSPYKKGEWRQKAGKLSWISVGSDNTAYGANSSAEVFNTLKVM